MRTAATHSQLPVDHVIDYRGIQYGVAEASENRVDELQQDYWWIDPVGRSLEGEETPLERHRLFGIWKTERTAEQILAGAAQAKGLLPIYLSIRTTKDLPRELASALESDESAILETLRLIGVAEIRLNGKVNFPDIFRVAFKMKRRGGVPPKRSSAQN